MTKPVHPFTQHHARFSRAVKRLPQAHDQAKEAAVSHMGSHVMSAANRAGYDTDDVGVYWHQDRPKVTVRPGSAAEAKEYGTQELAPNATVRNAARTANRGAVATYHRTMWKGIGF